MTTGAGNKRGAWWTVCIATMGIIAVLIYLYYDRHDDISTVIQSWGIAGICLAILFMAALCTTPIPSEGLLILFLKVYGVDPGILYAWAGSIVSSLLVFVVARRLGVALLQSTMSRTRYDKVNHWVGKKGTSGLLLARLLPIPAFLVNYAAGSIPSIGFWDYLWTAAITIVPYYVGAALLYLGASKHVVIWAMVGGLAFIPIWLAGYLLNRRK